MVQTEPQDVAQGGTTPEFVPHPLPSSHPPQNHLPSLYQVVQLRVITEEGLVLLLLLVDKVLDVDVEAGRGDALGTLSCLLALLKEQSQQREQRVPAEDKGDPCIMPTASGPTPIFIPHHASIPSQLARACWCKAHAQANAGSAPSRPFPTIKK